MVYLILGLTIFFAMHLVPSFTNFRAKLMVKLGEGRYLGGYAITSLIGIILVVIGMSKAQFVTVWMPPTWSKSVVVVIMVFVFYLFAAAEMKCNIKRFIRHPMLLGILLWSCVHLLANGDQASILLFGSFALYSVFAMFSANIRGAELQKKVYPLKKDVVSIIVGLVAYAFFVFLVHPYLIGVVVIAI